MYLDPRDQAMIGKETDCDDCGEIFILQFRNMSFDMTERCVLVICDECQGGEPFTEKVMNTTPCDHGTPQNQNCDICNIKHADLQDWEIDELVWGGVVRDEHWYIP